MEQTSLIYLMAPIYFYFKFSFILFLFILNIVLIFTHKKEEPLRADKEIPTLQSGFGSKDLKGFLSKLVTLQRRGGFLSAFITVKNEFKNTQIGKLDQLMETEKDGIRKSIDQDREIHQNILSSIENSREELLKLHIEKTKLVGQNDRLLNLQNSIKNNIISYQDKSTDHTTKLSDLGILDQLIKQDTNKFSQELDSLILQIEPTSLEEESTITTANDLKEANIFNFNISYSLEWFEGLNGIKKIAASMILGKSVIFSALISIIFIFYGNILIDKYDLENRYPRLAKLIQLRQKFQKYYFNYYCGLIISVILIEIAFALAVLTL